MMKKTFKIGDFSFDLHSDDEIMIPEMFLKFEKEIAHPEYSYQMIETDQLPEAVHPVITQRGDIRIEKTEAGENRYLGVKGMEGYYAFYEEQGDNASKVQIVKDRLDGLSIDPIFTSLLALERQMMKRDAFILHCAYMHHQGEAILFSAPSGTGKSTQANLWGKYRQSRTINGDRALLSFKGERLYANGWPVCGTSEICEDESTPVKAIVMLSQGKTNTIRRIQGREAFIQLYSQITLNTWNNEFVNKGMDFIEQIVKTVPMYHLSCTISEEAIEVLEKELYK